MEDWEKLANVHRNGLPISRKDPVTGDCDPFSLKEERKHFRRYHMVLFLGPKAAMEEIKRNNANEVRSGLVRQLRSGEFS